MKQKTSRSAERQISIRKLLKVMVEHDASDLYLTADAPPSYRIKGKVRPLGEQALKGVICEQLANACMSEQQRANFSVEKEMNLSLHFDDLGHFRVNIFRQRSHVGLVIRSISSNIPSIEDLKLPAIFKDLSMSKRGLIIMVGGTGSGKSTSLASMVDWCNCHDAGHIITIEDPVEFVHSHKKCIITQREVGSDTLNYHAALRSALRQAPDVILLGEIRDAETMSYALEFAETGHLAMSTLHANNANQAIGRILNFFPEERHPQILMNLALNLRAVLSQRLIRTPSGERVVLIEIMINTPRVADLILKGDIDGIKRAMAKGKQYHMQTFDQHLLQLWQEDIISEEEAIRNADAPNDLRLQMKMGDLNSDEDSTQEQGIDQLLSDGDSKLSI